MKHVRACSCLVWLVQVEQSSLSTVELQDSLKSFSVFSRFALLAFSPLFVLASNLFLLFSEP